MRPADWRDVVLVLAAFWMPSAGVFIYLILREVRSLRALRRRDQADAEAMAAEGFPPPGPPTTDSMSEPPE